VKNGLNPSSYFLHLSQIQQSFPNFEVRHFLPAINTRNLSEPSIASLAPRMVILGC